MISNNSAVDPYIPTEDGKYSSDVYDRSSCDCTLRSTLISD